MRPLVGRLVRTRVTPDALTVLRLATGMAAAVCFAIGGRATMAAGAGIFLVSMLLDRADGELARQSGRFSRVGARFDLWSDCIATMTIFVGLGIGVSAPWMRPGVGPWLGIVAAVSTAVTFAQLARLPMAGPAGVSRRFDPDDAMLLVPPAIWLGGAAWVLLAAGVLTPIAAMAVSGIAMSRHRQSFQSRASSAVRRS